MRLDGLLLRFELFLLCFRRLDEHGGQLAVVHSARLPFVVEFDKLGVLKPTEDLGALERVRPVYRTFTGWKSDTAGILDFDALPARARDYLRFIEDEVGAPVELVSTGPRREETALRAGGFLESLLADRFPAVLEGRGA